METGNFSESPFSPAYLDSLKEQRLHFYNDEELDEAVISNTVRSSWLRCKAMNVPTLYTPRFVSAAELKAAQEKNAILLSCAIPLIENIYESIADNGNSIGLSDNQGLILYSLKDKHVGFSKLVDSEVGLISSEAQIGTNGYGTSLYERRLISIVGAEHYALDAANWCCIGAPIFDFYDNIWGVINLCTSVDNIRAYTEAIVKSLALAISKQMSLQFSLHTNQIMLDSIDEATIFIDYNGTIHDCNQVACKMFSLKKGENIQKIFLKKELLAGICDNTEKWNDQELLFLTGQHKMKGILTAVKVDSGMGVLLVIKDIERLRQYANRIVGSTAYYTFNNIITSSPLMEEACKLGKIASGSDMTTLLQGESGTGKEVFAHAIHNSSIRSKGPFVVVNCSALPRELVESELFGYEAGSFTGANRKGKTGKFELADGGTLFLDEIGDMPLSAQTSLLRFLQEKEVTRVGGSISHRLDVRVIAATHQNLESMVIDKSFRLDLFYRLNVLTVKLPALRERGEDILLLAKYFLKKLCRDGKELSFSEEAMAALVNYPWPGNVRELQNCIEFAANCATTQIIEAACLPSLLRKNLRIETGAAQSPRKLSASRREAIEECLRRNDYNIQRTARELGCARSTIYRNLKETRQ